ncbi:MAG: cysteine rich repeat-containing protein [Hyphomicrobium sp.]
MTKTSLRIALAFAALAGSTLNAMAVSPQVRVACRSDYFAFCSAHAVGSPALRKCMMSNASRLSQGCKNALVASGEAGKTNVARKSGN